MKNEKRLIDANALKDRFKLRINWLEKVKYDEYTTGIWDGCLYDAKLIDEASTVDAVEVVHGRWLHVDDAEYECNQCRNHVCFDEQLDGSVPPYNYCPNCGADMRERKDDG